MVGQQNYYIFSRLIAGGVLAAGLYFGGAVAQIDSRLGGPRLGIESLFNYQKDESSTVEEGRRERRRATPEQLRRLYRRRYPALNEKMQEISHNILYSQIKIYLAPLQNRYK